jgi:hypothetical protein
MRELPMPEIPDTHQFKMAVAALERANKTVDENIATIHQLQQEVRTIRYAHHQRAQSHMQAHDRAQSHMLHEHTNDNAHDKASCIKCRKE